MKKIVAMVLAGGAFSALGIMAGRRAKAAIPFGGMYRIIDFVLSNLMNSETDYVGILAQYRPASLIDHVGGGASWDLYGRTRGIKILPPYKGETDSDWYRGTADAVYQNLNFIRDHQPSEVLILAGENVYAMNYQEVLNYHREKQADCTLVCNPLPTKNPHRFGIISLDQDGRIATYHEKPATITGDLFSAGIYVFNAEFLMKKLAEDAANPSSKHNFADDIIPSMLRAGDRFYGYTFRGYWAYCGTLDEYWQANMDLLNEPTALDMWKWNIRTNLDDSNVSGQHPALCLPTSKVKRALISPGCKISGTVENSVLSPGVIVEEGAVVRDSIIMNGTVIRRGAIVNRVIADKGVQIGAGVKIGEGETLSESAVSDLTLIGKEVTIGDSTQIGTRVLINHGKVIEPNQRIESGRVIQ